MNLFSSAITKIAHLLSPPACAYCCDLLPERSVLCDLCINRIWPIAPELVSLTDMREAKLQDGVTFELHPTDLPKLESHHIMIHAIGRYQEPLKSLIVAKRYGDRVASKQLGELLWRHTTLSRIPCDVLVPIPLHWRRYAYRGFNQAEEMARSVAHHNGATVVPALTRMRHTAYQSGLLLHERKSNVQAAFALNTTVSLAGKHVVLIDDLLTTGATITEAAKILMFARPASITAVVAARVMR